jgi:hypothetical protein
MHMEEFQDCAFQDYTIHNGIGIRVQGDRSCRVIRLVKGQWVEIGAEYCLPIDAGALTWTPTGIPATMLAVALRVYELDHPTSKLRGLLTGKPAAEENKRYMRPVRVTPLRPCVELNRLRPVRPQLATAK